MKKTTVSTSLDLDVVKDLERIHKGKISPVINKILRKAFKTPEGLQEQIDELTEQTKLLEAELRDLNFRNLTRLNIDRPGLFVLLEQANPIIEKNPMFISGQTNIINKTLNSDYSEDEILSLLDKLKERKIEEVKKRFNEQADALYSSTKEAEQ